MTKKKFIEQLQEGERIDEVFLVKKARLAETRAGKPYLLLELADRTGEIGGPVWDNAEQAAGICQVGSFVHLRGAAQSYRDKLQLRIEAVRPVDADEVELADFVAASPHDLGEMARQIQKLVASVENGWVRKLLNRFFQKGEVWERFQTAPAAKGIHHAYVGGLMEHCLSMARVADMMVSHYAGVDRSILMAGVMFHDIGKIKELKEEVGLVD
ncbi:MAG TPA: HDIG domain-containing protein, partial [Desulfopila sp.]|nr:HDIG domain-containing protein [Desulfopila sp.]